MNIPKQYLGAFKAGHRQTAREFIDEELSYALLKKIKDSNYTDQESMDALAYITKFNNEFHKNVVKKDDPNALHSTDKLRKDCYARENSRNRDIMSRENKFLKSLDAQTVPKDSTHDTLGEKLANENNNVSPHEDVMIDLLDSTTRQRYYDSSED
jgi:hypothetical protein